MTPPPPVAVHLSVPAHETLFSSEAPPRRAVGVLRTVQRLPFQRSVSERGSPCRLKVPTAMHIDRLSQDTALSTGSTPGGVASFWMPQRRPSHRSASRPKVAGVSGVSANPVLPTAVQALTAVHEISERRVSGVDGAGTLDTIRRRPFHHAANNRYGPFSQK
jgi:hypothetical protein